jgi:hypothetical protein
MAWHSSTKSVPEPASVESLEVCDFTKSECDIPDKVSTEEKECHLDFSLQPGGRFGLVLEEFTQPSPNGLLVVSNIDAESVFSWTVTGKRGVGVGDAIIKVNGKQAPAAELREEIVRLFSAGGKREIELVVRPRPATFSVDLRRGAENQQKLGLTVSVSNSIPGCLVVKAVQANGVVQAWNAANRFKRIYKGDLITHVNGVSQNTELMRKELAGGSAAGSALQLCVLNPSTQAGCHKADAVLETASEASTKASSTPRDRKTDSCRDSVGSLDSDKSSLTNPSVGAFASAREDARAAAKGQARKAAPKATAKARSDAKHIYWDFRGEGPSEDVPMY